MHLDEIQRLLDISASETVSERVLVGNKVGTRGHCDTVFLLGGVGVGGVGELGAGGGVGVEGA